MGVPRRRVNAFDADGLKALNEALEALSGNVTNAQVDGAAQIEFRKLLSQDLGYISVDTAEVAVPHKLPDAPWLVHLRKTGNVDVWESKPPSRKFIYLTASAAVRVRVIVAG